MPAKLQEASVLYLNDDPIRARLIPDFDNGLVLPIPPREASRAIVEALRSLLGTERVARTSEAPIETGFVRDASLWPEELVEFLDREFPKREVVSDHRHLPPA